MSTFIKHLYAPYRQYDNAFANCEIPEVKPSSHPDDGESNENNEQSFSQDKDKDKNVFIVSFDDTPEANPRNWSFNQKALIVLNVTLFNFYVNFASSISSQAIKGPMRDWPISQTVAELSTALFLFGFALGGLPFAPLSESLGRNLIYTVTLFICATFEIGAGAAQNPQTLLICRFFAGFFGAAPLSNSGGSLQDIYAPVDRAWAFPFYAVGQFLGPVVGPIATSYLSQNICWRWNYHLTYIFGFVLTAYISLTTRETLADEILRQKAKIFRQRTGKNWQAPKNPPPAKELAKEATTKVFKLLFKEPLLQYNTAYLSVVYFCLFGDLEAYTVVFGQFKGLDDGQVGLCFIAVAIGVCLAAPGMIPFVLRYRRKAAAQDSDKANPEEHYLPMIFGGIFLPIGLFWFGWTAYRSVSVWATIMSGIPFGFSVVMIYISTYQNIIDAYGENASSALGAMVFVRYLIGGACVLVIAPMFRGMKPWWASTLLGSLSAALLPLAMLLYFKGPAIRKRSAFAIQD